MTALTCKIAFSLGKMTGVVGAGMKEGSRILSGGTFTSNYDSLCSHLLQQCVSCNSQGMDVLLASLRVLVNLTHHNNIAVTQVLEVRQSGYTPF